MSEPWSTRWYTPLVVLGGAVLVLLVLALALVEVLLADVARVPRPVSWTTPLERSDEALRDGDVAQALTWWREANVVALRSRQWEGMIEVGDAARRLGVGAGLRRDGDALARNAYMTALLRARRQGSLDGMLRAAVGFGELGDREVVAHVVRLAERRTGGDRRAHDQVRAVADRWLTPPLEAGTRRSVPGGLPR
jgi:hypothetical protein